MSSAVLTLHWKRPMPRKPNRLRILRDSEWFWTQSHFNNTLRRCFLHFSSLFCSIFFGPGAFQHHFPPCLNSLPSAFHHRTFAQMFKPVWRFWCEPAEHLRVALLYERSQYIFAPVCSRTFCVLFLTHCWVGRVKSCRKLKPFWGGWIAGDGVDIRLLIFTERVSKGSPFESGGREVGDLQELSVGMLLKCRHMSPKSRHSRGSLTVGQTGLRSCSCVAPPALVSLQLVLFVYLGFLCLRCSPNWTLKTLIWLRCKRHWLAKLLRVFGGVV